MMSASEQTLGLNTYLLLLRGHGANGVVLKRDDDGGPVGRDSKLSEIFLASGDYTIEATSYCWHESTSSGCMRRFSPTGKFTLDVDLDSPGGSTGSVQVAGLPASSWATIGQSLELPFTFGYWSGSNTGAGTGDVPLWLVDVEPTVLSVSPASMTVRATAVKGSGTVTATPTRVGDYGVVLVFHSGASKVGSYRFVVKACPATQKVELDAQDCSVAARSVPSVISAPPPAPQSSVPSTCIERAPVQRWYLVERQWPSSNGCSLVGDSRLPARYFVFEVPFDHAEVTIRLNSTQDNRLILLGPVGSDSRVRVSENISACGSSAGSECVFVSDSAQSRIVKPSLTRGEYVIVTTLPTPTGSTVPAVSGGFTLNIKIPYPEGSCPAARALPGGAAALAGSAGAVALLANPPRLESVFGQDCR